jgi:hypothetical protein
VRRAVREQLRDGADFVKVMTTGARTVELEDPGPPQLTREALAALVDESHRLLAALSAKFALSWATPSIGVSAPR